MATENRHIEQIYDTRSNLQSNLDNGQIAIETDGTEQLVYKDDDGTYHIVANTAEAASFTNLTATGSLTIAETMYHSGDSDTYFSFADDQQTWVVGGVTMMDFTETTQDIISFNSGNVDVDFRVGATGATKAIFVNGATGAVSMEKTLQAQQLTGYNTADNAEAVGLRLWNYDPPLTGEVGQSVSIRAWLMTTANGGSSYESENAGSIVFGKISDYFSASGQADNDSYIGFLVCHNGTETERMRLINSGLLQIGAAPANALSTAPLLTANGIINTWSTGGGELHFYRDDDSIVDGNDIGMIKFAGADGGEQVGAQILVEAAGTWDTGDSPGKIGIYTTPSGSATPVVRLTIDAAGDSTFAGNIYLADDKAIGISGGARLVFDATDTPDTITVTSADVIVGDGNYLGLGAAKGRLVFDDETTDTLTLKTADFIVENTAASTITIQGSGTDDSVVAMVLKNTTETVTTEVGVIEFNAQDSTPGHYINFASISCHGVSSTGSGKMYLRTTLAGVETAVVNIVDGHVGIRGTPDTVTVLSLYGEAAFIRVASGGAYAIGLAYKYTNNSGSEIAANRIVKFSTANNASILLADQAGAMPIGITAAAIANGATGWVVVSGEAWVKFVSGDTPTRGDVAIVSTTDGEAEGLATIPAATHWAEIGHVPTTGTDGGVAKVQLHYN